MSEPRATFGIRPGLDGLRALAVSAILAFHSGFLKAGWVGVDLFFCLSGYLITGLLIAERERSRRVELREFWRRRARRLVPGVVLLLMAVVIIGWFEIDRWSAPSPSDVWGTITYTANWTHLANGRGYFQQFSAPSPLEHMWSLAVEEQFYLLWPLLFVGAWRAQGRRAVVVLAGALAGLTALWQVLLGALTDNFDRIYLGTDTRAPAFLLGALLVAAADRGGVPLRGARFLAPLGVALLAVASVLMDGGARWTYAGGLVSVSVIGALTVWSVARLASDSLAARVLGSAPLRLIGRWSYGIYLFHWPIAILLGLQRFSPGVQFVVVAALSTMAAAVSYELFEQRVRLTGIPRRFMAPVCAGLIVVVTAGVVSADSPRDGLTAEEKAALLAPIPLAPTSSGPQTTMPVTTSTATTTITGVGPVEATPGNALRLAAGGRRMLVIGDSVPHLLVDGWTALGSSANVTVAVRAAVGCRPSDDRRDQTRDDTAVVCAAVVSNLSRDLQQFRPSALVVHYGLADQYVRDAGRVYSSCADDGRAALTRQIEFIVGQAATVGATVFVVMPNDPPDGFGLDRRGDRFAGAECYRQTYLDVAGLHRANVRVLRLDRLVCPVSEKACTGTVNGIKMRYDGIHFSDAGSAIVLPWILARVFTAT